MNTETTMQVAIFDTNAGFLQWIGAAGSHAEAIRLHLKDVGFNEDVEYEFLALDVTDGQAAALSEWSSSGAGASDYPQGMPKGSPYDAEEVAALMAEE